jgi:carbohydrate ABC transporter membrane protein 1, CUT1 family (TC 3.A.1.1.-)
MRFLTIVSEVQQPSQSSCFWLLWSLHWLCFVWKRKG